MSHAVPSWSHWTGQTVRQLLEMMPAPSSASFPYHNQSQQQGEERKEPSVHLSGQSGKPQVPEDVQKSLLCCPSTPDYQKDLEKPSW